MREPRIGNRVLPHDYNGQRWLYHWTTTDRFAQILQSGCLRPGIGERLGYRYTEPRLFFSTQLDKWDSSTGAEVLLRVPTSAVLCYYDGGLWIYHAEEDSDAERWPSRLADCWTASCVSIRHIEVYKQEKWQRLVGERT